MPVRMVVFMVVDAAFQVRRRNVCMDGRACVCAYSCCGVCLCSIVTIVIVVVVVVVVVVVHCYVCVGLRRTAFTLLFRDKTV